MNRYFSVALLLVCMIFSGCFKPEQRVETTVIGTKIAFDYHPLSKDDIDYLSRFDLIVTHNPQDSSITKRLKARGGKLFFYEWLPALYYKTDSVGWEQLVYSHKENWTLDPKDTDPDPMGDKFHCKDYFYDMSDNELISRRVEYLTRKVKSQGYDGVFFDWGAGWYSLQENGYTFLTEEFEKRHPGKKYNDSVNVFIKKLKEKGLLVILNGGFRSENAELDKYADVDIVESMFTSEECAQSSELLMTGEGLQKGCETWFNTIGKSVKLATSLPRQAEAVNHNIRFLFLNYAFPYYREINHSESAQVEYEKVPDKQAIFYALALSYLGNASGFTNGTDVSLAYTKDYVYFSDLGKPVSDVSRIDDHNFIRYFSSGFIVVSDREAFLDVILPEKVTGLSDLYNSAKIRMLHGKVQIRLKAEQYPSGIKHPMGRLYLYEY